jgi:hypothetical protein
MSSNPERKTLLLAQHRRLRPLLIALDKEASEVLSTAADADGPELQILRKRIGSAQDQLEEHFVTEESVFESALDGVDGWGRVWLGHLRTSHKHQRKLLVALCAHPPLLAPHSLARLAAALAGDVLSGMVDEERDFEAVDLLEDDAPGREAC